MNKLPHAINCSIFHGVIPRLKNTKSTSTTVSTPHQILYHHIPRFLLPFLRAIDYNPQNEAMFNPQFLSSGLRFGAPGGRMVDRMAGTCWWGTYLAVTSTVGTLTRTPTGRWASTSGSTSELRHSVTTRLPARQLPVYYSARSRCHMSPCFMIFRYFSADVMLLFHLRYHLFKENWWILLVLMVAHTIRKFRSFKTILWAQETENSLSAMNGCLLNYSLIFTRFVGFPSTYRTEI